MHLFRRKNSKRNAAVADDISDDSSTADEAPNDVAVMTEYGLDAILSSETIALGLLGAAAAFARARWVKRGR